ncbi:MAG: hypothetical protein OEW00_12630 [candidate division Zixibacteria bacterium]|nr:hypothetical protein [candidate division Zixibacteria bacterium]
MSVLKSAFSAITGFPVSGTRPHRQNHYNIGGPQIKNEKTNPFPRKRLLFIGIRQISAFLDRITLVAKMQPLIAYKVMKTIININKQ